jgi:SEC-C motif domain protein
MNAKKKTSTPCPCGSESAYDTCCGPLHRGERKAATAQELMRARYCAFVKHEIDFIIDTAHTETHKETKREEIESWAEQSQWNGFEILDHEAGGEKDEQGMVEFVAHYVDQEGKEVEHHERSFFGREEGDWKFLDGAPARQAPFIRAEPKVGRNDPCPCGSGKKYKKCHGVAA